MSYKLSQLLACLLAIFCFSQNMYAIQCSKCGYYNSNDNTHCIDCLHSISDYSPKDLPKNKKKKIKKKKVLFPKRKDTHILPPSIAIETEINGATGKHLNKILKIKRSFRLKLGTPKTYFIQKSRSHLKKKELKPIPSKNLFQFKVRANSVLRKEYVVVFDEFSFLLDAWLYQAIDYGKIKRKYPLSEKVMKNAKTTKDLYMSFGPPDIKEQFNSKKRFYTRWIYYLNPPQKLPYTPISWEKNGPIAEFYFNDSNQLIKVHKQIGEAIPIRGQSSQPSHLDYSVKKFNPGN